MEDSQALHETQLVSETNYQPKQKDIITFMDAEWYNAAAEWYNAAAEGQIDKFKDYTEPLDLLRTPNKNTVLHVYITAVKKETEESIEFVKLVISKCPSLLSEPNIKGETPLHIAARFGHKNIVEFLIHSIKKAQYEDLERGAEASTSAKMLTKTSTDEDTALHEAVRNNHLQVVEILIGENPEFANIANAAGESPLHLAAVRENNIIASKILEICPSPAYSGPNGKTALHEAVISKDEDLIGKILEKNSSLTKEQDKEGCTPLHYASYFNLLQIVEVLLLKDAI
ncbi:ankyrin repeat-containing protein At5g02620-like [Hevea brasiliensis]|uniref:ankyrin repeat-containing protein At5g02620-like n=1 Tax=Hevea brasiliensis TaxID=3981 RepID=UPI0025E5C415|nr:ankyrin repeat-containing protein At5g02620-like [Hevea brasiliensis]